VKNNQNTTGRNNAEAHNLNPEPMLRGAGLQAKAYFMTYSLYAPCLQTAVTAPFFTEQ
jgi:hypothetical protein